MMVTVTCDKSANSGVFGCDSVLVVDDGVGKLAAWFVLVDLVVPDLKQ